MASQNRLAGQPNPKTFIFLRMAVSWHRELISLSALMM